MPKPTVRVEVNPEGVAELLKSDGVAADLKRRAKEIALAAGDGHDVAYEEGATRSRAAVFTETAEAAYAEQRSRTLTRAIDAGR